MQFDQDPPRCVQGLSILDYHADKSAVSSTTLKQILVTPAHCKRYLDGDGEQKEAKARMVIGSALHAAILEPEVFEQRFAIVPKIDRRTTAGKEKWADWQAEHAGKTLLAREEADPIARLRASIRKHTRAWQLMNLPGAAEVSLYWSDPETGLRLKARPDRLAQAPVRVLVEVKSTGRGDKWNFARRIVELDYHLSLAMYREGVKRAYGEPAPPVVFLVIEESTFEICLYKPNAAMLREGEQRFRAAQRLYAHCVESNSWPGYQPNGSIEEIALPRWARHSTADLELQNY